MRTTFLTRLLAVERVLGSEVNMPPGQGLASLLAYARKHQRDVSWDEDDRAENTSGLGQLLRQARAWRAAQEGVS